LAERIRVNLSEHHYKLGNGCSGRLSGSIGFAMYPFSPTGSRSLSWEQTVAVADHAAYTAKKNGRNAWLGVYGNRKCSWEDLTRTNINLIMLARQNVIKIRSSLDEVQDYVEETVKEGA
jgi:predicted signal transduction protein with EAL and GGDEF domain